MIDVQTNPGTKAYELSHRRSSLQVAQMGAHARN